MANPQAENGYTRIAHEVLEALMQAKLTGTQWDLVMAVIRMVWGWGKKQDHISLRQFQEVTGRHRNLIARELTALQKRNIIQQTRKPTVDRAAKWKFNKDWETWGSPPRVTGVTAEGDTSQGDRGVTAEGAKGVTAEVNLPKKEEKKKKRAAKKADPRFQPLIDFFLQEFKENRGVKLDANASDFKALKDLLKRRPELDEEYLTTSARMFIESKDKFHQGQGHPLRFWANNINSFIPNESRNENDNFTEHQIWN